MSETLYVKLEQAKVVGHSVVTLGDVAELRCRNAAVVNKAACEKVLTIGVDKNRRYVVSIMQIIEQINSMFENVEVQSVGETECVVEFQNQRKRNALGEGIKVSLICFILFFGAGFSIMSFNNDIDIRTMFSNIVSRFPVNQKIGQLVIATGYSIGIGLGIIIFYNHFINRKLSKDPTPIEVEMRKYEKEINLTLIQEYGRMKQGKRK